VKDESVCATISAYAVGEMENDADSPCKCYTKCLLGIRSKEETAYSIVWNVSDRESKIVEGNVRRRTAFLFVTSSAQH
jgi:hypothetical protein